MARDLTDEALRAIYGEQTSKVYVQLLTISHPDLVPPFRACDNREAVTQFAGQPEEVTFAPYAFKAVWPEDHATRRPALRIVIDNVDREIVQTLRTLATPPDIDIQLVRADDPDTVDARLPKFRLVEAEYDVIAVQGHLRRRAFGQDPWPFQRYTPASHPGIWPL